MNAETVRTLVVVTVVAFLVWMFAESRTLRIETVAVPVEISAGGSMSAFRLTDQAAWPGSVEVELAGPTGLIDGIRARAIEGITLEIGDELPGEPGARSVDLIDAVRRDELFEDSGLSIRRVTPRTVGLETDRLEPVTLQVEVDLEGLETSGPVTVEPSEVVIRLPAGVLNPDGGLASGAALRAVAKLPPSRLAALTPGRRSEISQVPVEIEGLDAGVWGARLVDSRVVVTLALRVRTQSLTIPEVPVRLSVLPSLLAVWSVEVAPEDRVLPEVVLTGPVSAVERIRRGEAIIGALATVDISPAEGEAAEVEGAATVRLVGLPAGVVSDLGDRTIRVVLRRRTATTPVDAPAGEAPDRPENGGGDRPVEGLDAGDQDGSAGETPESGSSGGGSGVIEG